MSLYIRVPLRGTRVGASAGSAECQNGGKARRLALRTVKFPSAWAVVWRMASPLATLEVAHSIREATVSQIVCRGQPHDSATVEKAVI